MILAIGFGILIYNADYKENKIKSNLEAIHSLKTEIYKFESKLSQLEILTYNIASESRKEKLYFYHRKLLEYKLVFDTLMNLDWRRYKPILAEHEFTEVNFNLMDTVFSYKKRVKSIFAAIGTMYRYKELVLNEKLIRENYRQLLEEQASLRDLYLTMDSVRIETIVNKLLFTYRDEVDRYKDFITERVNGALHSLNVIDNMLTDIEYRYYSQVHKVSHRKLVYAAIFIILFVFLVLFISYYLIDKMWQPLHEIIEITNKLSIGELPEYKAEDRYDEVGLIGETLEKLVLGLKQTINFAQALSKGNFDYKFKPMSEKDVLGAALIEMRESLLLAKKEEEKRKKEDYIRNRSAEATALFADILRKYQNKLDKLGDEIIINLVRFFNANQGMFFILNDKDESHKYLELLSAYAWNRKKYLDKIIEIGEGLVGAVAIEKFTVYMTDVPEDYIEIKSGTGEASPTSILIVPLISNDEVLGVIEIASFYEFEAYEIQLIENIAESIAATLRTAKMNEQTAELLERFQVQTAEMKEQELVMRQTIETLRKTEEEYRKKEKELQESLKDLEALNKQLQYKDEQLKLEVEKIKKQYREKLEQLEKHKKLTDEILKATLAAIFIVNSEGKITFVNKSALDQFGYSEEDYKNKTIDKFFDIVIPKGETLYSYFKNNIQEFKEKGKELKFINKYGERIDVLVHVIEKFDELILFVKNMAFYKERQQQIEKQIEQYMKNELELLRKIELLKDILRQNNIPEPDFSIIKKKLVDFSEKFHLGIEVIDKQHAKWFEFINKLYLALEQGEARSKLNEVFKELVDYTNYHFGFEEKYMKDFKLPIYESHKNKHQEFVSSLLELYNEYLSGKVDTPYKLLLTLKKWVESHVLYDDRKYADDFRKHGLK